MSHTYAQNVIHVVFSTKDRRKAISKEFQPQIWAYAAGICKNHDIFVHAVGGTEDHIHLLIQVPPALALANAVLAIKSNSSRWANEEGHPFAWQQGYAAFTTLPHGGTQYPSLPASVLGVTQSTLACAKLLATVG